MHMARLGGAARRHETFLREEGRATTNPRVPGLVGFGPWYSYAMRTTIDSAGRVVIPKEMRSRLGLSGGQEVDIQEREGRIEIEPALVPMTLEERGQGPVAVPDEDLPPLSDELVRETLERTRR